MTEQEIKMLKERYHKPVNLNYMLNVCPELVPNLVKILSKFESKRTIIELESNDFRK